MEVKAKLKNLKMSPRKVRLVIDLVRGLKVDTAINQLKFLNKKAAKPIRKLIESSVANADNNFELKRDNLYIKEIKADDGPTMKRWKPRAYGKAGAIRKRTSCIDLILGEIKDSGVKKGKKQDIEAPVSLDKLMEQQSATSKESGKGEEKKKVSKKKE